jgi:hypothetical protein
MMKGTILICAICTIALATASFDETVPEESLLQGTDTERIQIGSKGGKGGKGAKPPVIAPRMVKPPPLIMKPPTTARMTGTVSRCFGNGKETKCTKGFIGWGGYKINGAPCKSNTCSTKKPTNCKFPKDKTNNCYWAVKHIRDAMKEKTKKEFTDWHGFYCGTKENPGFMEECLGKGKVCDLSCHKGKDGGSRRRRRKGSRRRRKAKKAGLKCTINKKSSNSAGLVHVGPAKGTTVTGGGMNNRYRGWDKLGMFEDMYPGNNRFTCDTGYGPGKLTCYSISCSKGGKPLKCETRKKTKNNFSGIAKISPRRRKYTMTGGGLINHYRGGNGWKGRKSMFEDSRPSGRGWVGDMGAGRGDFTAYVRGCKDVKCKTVKSNIGNVRFATCPTGYQVTGCGIKNEYRRHWSKLSAFEESYPISSTKCRCDGGFGKGRIICYARCCK